MTPYGLQTEQRTEPLGLGETLASGDLRAEPSAAGATLRLTSGRSTFTAFH